MAIRQGTFLVGGAVRDALLGRGVSDRDWVVVGRSVEEMLADGYTQVGKDFPVFLHPETHEEYALARTERKIAAGHQGFVCHAGTDVSLEDDLLRRDLTVNALAQRPDGELIDPYGGEQDLRDGLLRHVSPAFAEDPLRILRVARFAAQLGFAVAAETEQLMREMAAADALAELPAERVWQEFQKVLGAADPVAFVRVLYSTKALEPWFSEFAPLVRDDADWAQLEVFGSSALQRFASLGLLFTPVQLRTLGARIKAPRRYERLGASVAQWSDTLVGWRSSPPDMLLGALQQSGSLQLDAAERRDDFLAMLAMLADARGEFEGGALTRLANNVATLGADAAVQAAVARGEPIPQGKALGAAIAVLRCTHIAAVQAEADGI